MTEQKARYSVSAAQKASQAVERTRVANKTWAERRKEMRQAFEPKASWKRETHVMPRDEARAYARSFFKRYPKPAYWTEVESWRILDNQFVEFTMRRLPTVD